MQIRFKQINIENFRSIEQAHINLDNQGIVIVKGVNEYENNATSNGSGKSSIFEAIIFALFDETSSGDKDIANRINNSGYCVNLEFYVDKFKYIIQRQSRNNKTGVVLYKDGVDISCRNKTDTNKLIMSIIGISKSIFLDSIFLSQNISTNLASLSPTARKERLEILTNTDNIITSFKEQIKNKQIYLESKIVDLKLELNKFQGAYESLQQQLLAVETQITDGECKIKQRESLGDINEINNDITSMSDRIEDYKAEISKIDADIFAKNNSVNLSEQYKELINKKSSIDSEILDLRNKYSNVNYENSKCIDSIRFCEKRISEIQQEQDKIKNSDTCPVCHRKYENVDSNGIKSALLERDNLITDIRNEIADYNATINANSKILDDIQQQGITKKNVDLHNIEIEIEAWQNEKSKCEQLQNSLLENKSNLEQKVKNLQLNIRQKMDLKDTILNIQIPDMQALREMRSSMNTDIDNYKKNIESVSKSITELSVNIDVTKNIMHLITTDFRAYLLHNSISYLNKLLEKYSNKLFSNKSDVIHIEDTESKLNIYLGNASYESLSGGEKTRVNIALLLAQKSLACELGNTWSNIIILDEILGYCDSYAEERVIDLIITELQSLESIFMVSHKELPIGYDNQIVVTKDSIGLSHVKQQ